MPAAMPAIIAAAPLDATLYFVISLCHAALLVD